MSTSEQPISRPGRVMRSRPTPTGQQVDEALATLRAGVPASLLVLFAWHVDAMKWERAIGHLTAEFHMHYGDIRAAVFERRTSWRRTEPVEQQRPEAKP